MMIDEFNNVIDIWINTIQRYNFNMLCKQPDKNNWSLGQTCVHLLNDTNWFLEQIKICLSNDDNASENMLPFVQTLFQNNSFPDEKLTNPSNANMPQPGNKIDLLKSFINLKNEMNTVATQLINTTSKGKTKHPGFNYFNATEWLQFTVMHLQHHLKQKQRIEDYLNIELNSK